MTFDLPVERQGTSVPPSPSTSPSPGHGSTLDTVDIVVLVIYFLLVLGVGLWVSTENDTNIFTWRSVFFVIQTKTNSDLMPLNIKHIVKTSL